MSDSGEERLDVVSGDGTTLAVWRRGEGPPLVLVHGSMQDHTANRSFVDALAGDLTTWSLDRRGCGASEDSDTWSIEREFDDVAAVIDAVSDQVEGPVAVWGHSFGAACAMGGAARSESVSHLVLYEPSLGLQYPAGSIEAAEEALAAGDHDRVLEIVLTGVLEMGADDVAAMQASPGWPARRATAPTLPRECRAEQEWQSQPAQFTSITAPTLLLSGTESGEELHAATEAAEAAIPNAAIHVLAGHGHLAIRTDRSTSPGSSSTSSGADHLRARATAQLPLRRGRRRRRRDRHRPRVHSHRADLIGARLPLSPTNGDVRMSITEQQRHRLIRALEQALGEEEAASLMEYLPPVGWADVATKRDLDQFETRFDLKLESLEHRFDARLQAELRRQTMTMLPAIAALLAVFAAISALF